MQAEHNKRKQELDEKVIAIEKLNQFKKGIEKQKRLHIVNSKKIKSKEP